MGLFDFFRRGDGKKTKSDKEIAKLGKLVGDKFSQNYDRQEALEELVNIGNRSSAIALLKRFTWTLDPSITDREEKQLAVDGIIAAGEDALEPLHEFIRKADSITWPLKILKGVVSQERLVEELVAILGEFDTEYTRNPEPKVQLIQSLEGHREQAVREAVEPFLQDVSEQVRFAAVGTVFAMDDEASVPALVGALSEEESLRIKNRIARGIHEREWSVPAGHREACAESLPPDFVLREHLIVLSRG